MAWTSSSVLLSSLYPFVALLFGVAVVVRLLVESVFKSFMPFPLAVVARLPIVNVAGFAVVEAVVFLIGVRTVVEFVIVPVVLLGLGVYDDGDGFCALGSVI